MLSGCASANNLVPSAGHPLSFNSARYQQAVEERHHVIVTNINQAIRSEEVVLSGNPRYVPGYIRLAGLFFESGDVQSGLQALQTACSLNPHNAQDWVILGQAEERYALAGPAQKAFGRAVALNPALWTAWDGQGFLAVSSHQDHKAWQDAERATLVGGEQGPTLDLMGQVLLGEGDAQDALTYFTDAEEVEPSWWQSYYNAAQAQLALGDRQDAIKSLNQATALNPGQGLAWQLKQRLEHS